MFEEQYRHLLGGGKGTIAAVLTTLLKENLERVVLQKQTYPMVTLTSLHQSADRYFLCLYIMHIVSFSM